MARQAEKRNIAWLYWQFCSDFGVYDCQQDCWDDDLLNALIP
jgi:endoglucanase